MIPRLFPHHPRRATQRGAVLIIVLWFIAILSLLIATLANEVRFSAQVVAQHKSGVENWAKTLSALRIAEMELLVQRMPEPPSDSKIPLNERIDPLDQFDGRIVKTSYPLPEGVSVRIFDLSGFINLRTLNTQQLRDILRQRIGEDDEEKLESLMQVWQDWTDGDDLKRLNGAEKEYYGKLDPPYDARNAQFETVDELNLLKGYDEVLEGIDIYSAFTTRGSSSRLNINLANPEALRLVPGMTESIIDAIISLRNEAPLKNISDIQEYTEGNQWAKISPWLATQHSNYYLIAVQIEEPKEQEGEEEKAPPTPKQHEYAYIEEVQVLNNNQPPKILMVRPYGRMPEAPPEPPPADKEKAPKDAK